MERKVKWKISKSVNIWGRKMLHPFSDRPWNLHWHAKKNFEKNLKLHSLRHHLRESYHPQKSGHCFVRCTATPFSSSSFWPKDMTKIPWKFKKDIFIGSQVIQFCTSKYWIFRSILANTWYVCTKCWLFLPLKKAPLIRKIEKLENQ